MNSRGSPASPEANDPAAEHNEDVNDVVKSTNPDVFKPKVDPKVIQEEKPNENAVAQFEPAVALNIFHMFITYTLFAVNNADALEKYVMTLINLRFSYKF